MRYLGLTQGTAEWLLGKAGLLDQIHAHLVNDNDNIQALNTSEVAEGPIRISATADGELVAIWNTDYLSGTGEELWGFVRTAGPMSLEKRPDISQEVLERCLYVINQRLQGLMLDGSLIHRAHQSNTHTCLAGRGSVARQVSVGYFEHKVDTDQGPAHSLICVGPEFDFALLAKQAERDGEHLAKLVIDANELISVDRKRPLAPAALLPSLRAHLTQFSRVEAGTEYRDLQLNTDARTIERKTAYQALGFTYDEWLKTDSPLTEAQRRIIDSDAIEKHPIRIVGPGGSGKTLLLQLLALRRLRVSRETNRAIRLLYITHNEAMAGKVRQRFEILEGNKAGFEDEKRELDITTLAHYGLSTLSLPQQSVVDPDAEEAKQFQLQRVTDALEATMAGRAKAVGESELFSTLRDHAELMPIVSRLVMAEISTAIKGHGLEGDKKRYVNSERRLSRLHGLMSQAERDLIYETFLAYHKEVFEYFEVLDSDDIALSLLGRLRSPLWELQRKSRGYDFVFVDEAQLFNENERRVLPLLTKKAAYVPIVLALDEAQDIYAQSSAGLATLGIPDIANENLGSIHRSTRAIVQLAFFIIQRSTDLFGADFPDFTSIADVMEPDNHPLALAPKIDTVGADSKNLGRFVLKRIRDLRKANLRQIAVICHADVYWDQLESELKSADLPLQVLTQRGTRLPSDQPLVVLSKPLYVGGQEFDAAILVGLEQGVAPPRIANNEALSSALEQQSVREMYLAVTRARYRIAVIITDGAVPNSVLQEAEKAGLISRR